MDKYETKPFKGEYGFMAQIKRDYKNQRKEERNNKPSKVEESKNKILTVRDYRRDVNNKMLPAILLQGKQLEQYGFNLNQKVCVQFSKGQIMIKPQPEI